MGRLRGFVVEQIDGYQDAVSVLFYHIQEKRERSTYVQRVSI